jgi:SNF2 family DNA or RNA helicase
MVTTMSESSKSRKDEVLDLLIAAKNRRDAVREQYRTGKAGHEIIESQKRSLEQQVEQLRKQLTDVSRLWHESTNKARDLERLGQDCTAEVTKLERELSRIMDAERVKAELASMAKQFAGSCLDAAWRAENRTDGMGAKSYQIEGAVLASVAKRVMLADDMGLGKSLTSLIWCDMSDAKKVIVVCPSDTMYNYLREVMLWTPHRFPVVLGQKSRMERDFLLEALVSSEHFMLIVNYEAWRRDPELLPALNKLKADTIIVDESHNIMHGDSGATDFVHGLVFAGNYCANCYSPDITTEYQGENMAKCLSCKNEDYKWQFSTVKRVMPMSGTGILNKPQDLWSQLHIVDPERFPTIYAYLQDFCEKKGGYVNGVKQPIRWGWQTGGEARLVRIIGPRYIARTQEDAGLDLPPLKPKEHLITQDVFKEDYPDQWKAYQQVRDYAQLLLDPNRKIAMSMPNVTTALLRLRQVLVWPHAIELALKDEESGIVLEKIPLNVYESVKVDKAESIIREITETGERVVVFSQFVGGIEELQRRLGERSVLYYGSTSTRLRQAIQLDFDVKTAPPVGERRWDVVLAHYKSGGVGLNFNTVRHVIYLDPAWNPGTKKQGSGRARRIGNEAENILVHDIRVEKTVDTWMAAILTQKENIIDGFDTEAADLYQRARQALRDGEM